MWSPLFLTNSKRQGTGATQADTRPSQVGAPHQSDSVSESIVRAAWPPIVPSSSPMPPAPQRSLARARRVTTAKMLDHSGSTQVAIQPRTFFAQVLALGFTEWQLRRAVKDYSPKGIYQGLLNFTSTFLRMGLFLDDVVKVAGNDGGTKALEALSTHGPALVQVGYEKAEIINWAGNNGGAQALAALDKHGPALPHAGYVKTDIAKVAGNIGGAQALEALNTLTPKLVASGFSLQQLTSIAARAGSTKKLGLVATHRTALKASGIPIDQIVLQASRQESLRNFEAWTHSMNPRQTEQIDDSSPK